MNRNNMEHRIEVLDEKKLIGKSMSMSFADNKTADLWGSFMPRRKEIQNNIGTNLYSMQIYGSSFFDDFDPTAVFEKWAAVEVTDYDTVPNEMETTTLPGGRYVVFLYRGSSSEAAKAFEYIFGTWIPKSDYVIDQRPHFEILGEQYKNADANSAEEIWIPIKLKA